MSTPAAVKYLFLVLLSSSSLLAAPTAHVITVDATINPATADFIRSAIERAEEANVACLVIRLNTPGGVLKSTRVIVSDILAARVPVIVYVAPGGSQAASAGTFITLAAHVAAMAPGTNIGAAHPVGMQGGEKDSVMNEKVTNDAAAFIRTIAEQRKRNVQWAEEAVRKSLSITESEALSLHVIEYIAPTVQAVLDSVDGRTVQIGQNTRILTTKDATIEEFAMDWKHELLDLLSNPNVAYILFMVGLYGLMFELYNPGSILPGVVGVIAIILALYSLHTMPVNYAGLALILFAIILFIAEIKVTSYGLLSVAGIISLTLGSIMLIDAESPLEFIRISWSVIVPVVLLTAAFFAFAIGMGIKAQKRKPTTGAEGLLGETGETITVLNPEGQVRVHGEIWSATSEEGKIPPHTRITVVAVQNLQVRVKRTSPNQ